jgi:hypothetical protein
LKLVKPTEKANTREKISAKTKGGLLESTEKNRTGLTNKKGNKRKV